MRNEDPPCDGSPDLDTGTRRPVRFFLAVAPDRVVRHELWRYGTETHDSAIQEDI